MLHSIFLIFIPFYIYGTTNVFYVDAFNQNDEVLLYVNKVGPYFNPHETYHYYELPVCRPKIIEHKSLSLGEVLDGDRMAKSLYKINFLENFVNKEICSLTLSEDELQYLKEAIEEEYYFEFVIDDIPIRDFVGHLSESGFVPHTHKVLLWTHNHFTIYYNGDAIIYANTTTEHKPIDLDNVIAPYKYSPTYSVTWIKSSIPYKERGILVQDSSFFPKTLEIHWLSVINSSILVFLLMGFVALILTRVLRNDFARYNPAEKSAESLEDDSQGWKIIHTEVFRMPDHVNILAAILGVGVQFLTIGCGIIIMALLGIFNVHRHGSVNSAALFLYSFTSFLSGYVSAYYYRKMSGKKWVWNVNLTTVLFAGPFFLIWSLENSIAWAYQSTQALPVATVILLLMMWICVGYPLTIVGGILGRRNTTEFEFPCRARKIPRQIPVLPWYKSSAVQCSIGGFLPFSAISVEMYYIISTLWGREQYTLYGILALVFVMVISVTACVSFTLTYFQLSSEDYRWWWKSIFSAGSTSVFILLYCLFYYLRRSNMSGILQTTEFIGWSVLMSYVYFLSLGTVSFFSSLFFVKYIYANLKMD